MIKINIGEQIPQFNSTTTQGTPFTLDDLKGSPTILYFYPKDNTSGCTAEACSLRDHYGEFRARGYEVIGVSVDSAASHRKFIDKYELPFTLIADTDTTLLQLLGCWGEKVACGRRTIGTLRTTYLVSEDGVIEKIFTPKEIKTKIHAEQILSYINGNN